MSYEPKNWLKGQRILASDLNHMEQGIAGAADPFIITLTATEADFSGTMDKTPAEIRAAYLAGRQIYARVKAPGITEMESLCPLMFATEDGEDLCCHFQIFYTIAGGTDVIIHAMTRTESAAYGTSIYPMTQLGG